MSQQGFAGNPFTGSGDLPGEGAGCSNFRWTTGDLGNILGAGAGSGGVRGRAAAQKGDDVEAELHLSFAEAVKGATRRSM